GALLERDLVTAIGKIVADGRRGCALDLQLAVQWQDTRLFGSLLGVHAAIEHTVEEVGMADRLVLAAHHPERHHRATVFDEHPGNDRVERPLAGRNGVGMPWDRAKTGPTVVQQDAALRCQDAGSETRKKRVDER